MSSSEREGLKNEIDLLIGESALYATSKPKAVVINHDAITNKAMQLIDAYVESQKHKNSCSMS